MPSNRKRMRWIGIWNECPGIFPHPKMLMESSYPDHEREAIANYIEQTPAIIGMGTNPFYTAPSLLEGPEVQLSLIERCDGCWAYHDFLAYYVRKGIKLPEAFVQHVRATGYCPPPIPVDYRLVHDDYGGYWIFWSITHSKINLTYMVFLVRLMLFYPLRLAIWPFRRRLRGI